MLKELVEFLVGVGKTQVETERKLTQTPVTGAPDVVVLSNGSNFGLIEARDASPGPTFAAINGLLDGLRHYFLGGFDVRLFLQNVNFNECKNGQAYTYTFACGDASSRKHLKHFDSEVERLLKRHDFGAQLMFTDAFVVLAKLVLTDRVGVTSPADLVHLLSRKLGGLVDRASIAPFRRVDFKAVSTGKAVNERGASEFGRSVEAAVQNVESIPEAVHVECPVFIGLQYTISVAIQVDPEPNEQGFRVFIRPAEFEAKLQKIQTALFESVQALAVALHEECLADKANPVSKLAVMRVQ